MKKKLSFLLALVMILSLAFGMITTAGASGSNKLNYNANGGSGGPSTVYGIPDNSNYTLAQTPAPTRAPDSNYTYSFAGWGLNSNDSVANVVTSVHFNTHDKTVYAIWAKTARTFTLHYDANGGNQSSCPADVTGLHDDDVVTLSTQAPTRNNDSNYSYSFVGWGNNSNSSTPRTLVTIDKADDTVYAIWNKTALPQYGSITIEKKVTGSGGSLGEYFAITVTFTGSNLGSIAYDVNHTDATVTLQSATATTATYLISMDHNDNVTFSNIPVGATYVVSETLTPTQIAAGWSKDTSKGTNGIDYEDSGKNIDDNHDTDWVKVWNKYTAPDTGWLKIKKALDMQGDTDYGTSPDFTINVIFTGPYLTGIVPPAEGVTSLGNGEYNVMLQINGEAIFTNIPVGVSYVIDELTMPSTAWTKTGITNTDDQAPLNTIDFKDDDDIVTVTNKYTKPVVIVETGSLSIDKTLNDTGDGTKQFSITVVFTGSNLSGITNNKQISGTPGDNSLTFTFMLRGDDQPVLFSGIPLGTHYLVSEADAAYYTSTITPESGDITSAQQVNVGVHNVYSFTTPDPTAGTLRVEKVVSGSTTTDPFTIVVTFTFDSEVAPEFSTGGTGSITDVDGNTYTLSLSNGQYIDFIDIPFGTSYTIVETTQLGTGWSKSGEREGIFDEQTAPVTIVNSYESGGGGGETTDPPVLQFVAPVIETSSLTVTKTVSGDVAQAPAESFDFTVTFTPGGEFSWNVFGISAPAGATGGAGTFSFTLTAGQSVTFSNIPVGTTYSVVETTALANGWTAGASTGASGSIGQNGASATIDNVFTAPQQEVAGDNTNQGDQEQGVLGEQDVLPQTGGISSATLLAIFGLALIAVGGTTFTIFRKKNTSKSKSK